MRNQRNMADLFKISVHDFIDFKDLMDYGML